jgi:LytR cell envelope-related transcriptional attenuator
MFVERIERHDLINAVMLAAVLLLLGFGIVTALNDLMSANGMVETTKTSVTAKVDPAAASTAPPVFESTTLPDARPAAEVRVRVGNGARRPGVAGAGTEKLHAAGYPTLPPKNGPTMDDSVVYYANGFAAEAAGVAVVLGLEPTKIAPMPADPGLPIEGADVIAVLGVNSLY